MKSPRHSIKDRVRTLILLVSVTVLFLTAAAFFAYEVLSFKAQLVRNVGTLAAVIANNAAPTLGFQSPETASDILSALTAEPDIEQVALYDEEEKLFAYHPPHLRTNLLPARPGLKGYRFEDRGLEMVTPVTKEGKDVGTLYIRMS